MAPPRGRGGGVPLKPAAFPLVGGVDTKVSGFILPAPKLQVCENAHSDRTGSLQRRPGRTAFTSLVQSGGVSAVSHGPAATATYKNALLLLTDGSTSFSDAGRAYEYSETLTRWIDKGDAFSPRVRSLNIAKSGAEAGAKDGDSATANGVTVHAYVETEASGANIRTSVRVTISDANGVVLKRAHTLFTTTAAFANLSVAPRCVARGTRCYVFWYDPDGTDLRVAIFDAASASSLGTMEPTPVTVTGDINTTFPLFDVVANTTYGIFVVWNDTTAVQLAFGFVSTTGVLASTSTSAMANDPTSSGFITCAVADGDAMHGIVYSTGTSPNDLYALHRSWSGSAWTATATSGALDTAVSGDVINIGCRYTSATSLRMAYTDHGGAVNTTVYQATYTTAGAASSRVATLRNSWLISKPILGVDLNLYFWVMAHALKDALATPMLFLMRQDGVPIARALDVPGAILTYNSPLALPQIEAAGNAYSVTVPYPTGSFVGTTYSPVALRRLTVDMIHADNYATAESGEALYVAGGYLQMYDGDSVVESGFLLPFNSTDVPVPTPSTTGGTHLTLLAIYTYEFIYEWTNIRGERDRGTNLGSITCPALTGANDTLTFALPTLAHTRKRTPRGDVVIVAYRTLANPGADAPHYRVGEIANDPTVATVTFVDALSDAAAATSEQFYQDSGELENTAPPAGHILASGKGRVLVAGFADKPNTVVCSKTRVTGRALEFSDFLPEIVVPDPGGPITALAVMNETILVFKETQIYRVRGEGPNNLGFGEFFPPELISADTGTTMPRSVVVTPRGVLFEGVKGKLLLNQSFQVEYIGAPLEKLAAPGACTGATLIPILQQVRFSYLATTHVYDYFHQQWYVFTHGSSGVPCLWNDVLVSMLAANGQIYREDPTAWTDAGTAYTASLYLGWARDPSTLQGNLRLRGVGLTGESLAAHNLQVALGYDYVATFEQQIFETFAGAGVLKHNWRAARQLANAVTIRIQDNDAGGAVIAGAGFRLHELVFEFIDVRSPGLGRD